MKLAKRIELIDESVGHGPRATKGDRVAYNARLFLRGGDEVTRDAEIIDRAGEHVTTRRVGEALLIDHTTQLGKRNLIAGIEKSLFDMRAGGYREVLVWPHLAYGTKGVPGVTPANAMLRIQIWRRDVRTNRNALP